MLASNSGEGYLSPISQVIAGILKEIFFVALSQLND